MPQHTIELTVNVYLVANPDHTEWTIAPETLDGLPLEPVQTSGPDNTECDCDDPADCERATAAMQTIAPPTGHELAALLAAAASR
jgi:hypothetical protein